MPSNKIQPCLVKINLGDKDRRKRWDNIEQIDMPNERLNQQRRILLYHKRSLVCQEVIIRGNQGERELSSMEGPEPTVDYIP